MITRLFFHILAGILGLFFAVKLSEWETIKFIYGIEFSGPIQTLLITGGILGLANFFIKPILNAITFPLRIITFGLFSFIINMVLVWVVVDVFSPIEITGLVPLFWTTIIIWGLGLIFGIYNNKRK